MASYYVYSGAAGSANGTNWANAYTTLGTAVTGKVAGDTFYVAHDHSESTAGALTITPVGTLAAPAKIICVDRAGSVPPVSADRRATAVITMSIAANLTLAGIAAHYDGIIFNAGTGSTSSANIVLAAVNNAWMRLDNCSLRLGITISGSAVIIGGSTTLGGTYAELNNTTMSFANAGHVVRVTNLLRWRNTPSALLGTAPTALFNTSATRSCWVECVGVDFSAMGSGKTIADADTGAMSSVLKFVDCKLNASVTKSDLPVAPGNFEADYVRSGSAGTNYTIYSQRFHGSLVEETTIVRNFGASDGTTAISWKIVTTASCTYSLPFECPPVAIWNDTTGSAVTATVEGIAATLPTDQEVWLEMEYLGDASSPQGSFVNDGKADLLATAANQTSSSETWGGSTAAFKLAATFTPAQKGWVYCRVKIGKASSTVYIDPLVTLT